MCSEEDVFPPWIGNEVNLISDEKFPSYLVIKNLDWEKVPFAHNVPLPPSRPRKLIKYSEAVFSPVSSFSAKHIQLACPSFYRDIVPDAHSTLVSDELDSAFVEKLDWRETNRKQVEHIKITTAEIPVWL